jgi:hypothetical protein
LPISSVSSQHSLNNTPSHYPLPQNRRSARLSADGFSQFLGAIKALNAGAATRDETLTRAAGLLPGDLYSTFEMLLARHLP